jgi:hypothetical protein
MQLRGRFLLRSFLPNSVIAPIAGVASVSEAMTREYVTKNPPQGRTLFL